MIIQDNKIIESPLISVIVVTYNQEATISQTLECILNQKCSYPFEIIIGEDFSTDSTRNICIEYQNKYPNTIKLLLHEENQGILKNYYATIISSKGKYIAQCAGDDYWHNSNKLQMQIDFLEKNPEFGIVHTEYNELDSKTGKITLNIHESKGGEIPQGDIMKELFYNYNLAAPTICFRKNLFIQKVPFTDFIKMGFKFEDLPTFVIMSKYCKVGYLPISTATYRRGHSSASNQNETRIAENFYNSHEIVNKYLCNMFPDDLKFDEKSQRIYKYRGILTAAYKSRDFVNAKKYGRLLNEDGVTYKMILFSRNRFLFYLFTLFKKLYKSFE